MELWEQHAWDTLFTRELNQSPSFPLSNTGVGEIAAFLDHLFTHVLEVLLHKYPSA